MTALLDLQNLANASHTPSKQDFQHWLDCALKHHPDDVEVNIVIVTKQAIQELNATYRHQDKATNVLSFPFEQPPGLNLAILGDIALCHDVIAAEAEQHGKSLQAHYAHLTIHGCLHLLGYDHINENDAEQMESLEIELMTELEYPNPYENPGQVEHVRE